MTLETIAVTQLHNIQYREMDSYKLSPVLPVCSAVLVSISSRQRFVPPAQELLPQPKVRLQHSTTLCWCKEKRERERRREIYRRYYQNDTHEFSITAMV